MQCPFCKGEIQEGAVKCKHCGSMLVPQGASSQGSVNLSPSASASVITDEEFSAFIGVNALKYIPKFKKFNIQGVDNFKATWNWAAFFFTPLWCLYRKLYLWALLSFIAVLILPLITNIVVGIAANFQYYTHAKKKISEVKTAVPNVTPSVLAEMGGVHGWVKGIGIAIIVIAILAIFLAIMIVYKSR